MLKLIEKCQKLNFKLITPNCVVYKKVSIAGTTESEIRIKKDVWRIFRIYRLQAFNYENQIINDFFLERSDEYEMLDKIFVETKQKSIDNFACSL